MNAAVMVLNSFIAESTPISHSDLTNEGATGRVKVETSFEKCCTAVVFASAQVLRRAARLVASSVAINFSMCFWKDYEMK